MAPPFKQPSRHLYGTGISREGSLIDFGVEHDIVKKSGAWFTMTVISLAKEKKTPGNT